MLTNDVTVIPVTAEHEARILASPATRRLVHQILSLARDLDPIDAIDDVSCALAILVGREDRAVRETWPALSK